MALNLFEYINIEATQDEYSVETLRKKLCNPEEIERQDVWGFNQRMFAETDAYLAEIARQIENETDAKRLLQLKKMQNHVELASEKMHAQIAEENNAQHNPAVTADSYLNEFAQHWLQQEPYAESFAQAYRIKEEAYKRGDDAKIEFIPYTEEMDPRRLKPEGQFYQEVVTDSQPFAYFALHVDTGNGLPFNIIMEPSDRNDARTQMRIVLAPKEDEPLDLDNPEIAEGNKSKIRKIIEFCEKYGFSTFDMHLPMTFDGKVDENAFYEAAQDKIKEREKEKQLEAKVQKEFAEVKKEIEAEHITNWQKEREAQDKKRQEIEEYAAKNPEEKTKVDVHSLDEVPATRFGTASQEFAETNKRSTPAMEHSGVATAPTTPTADAAIAPGSIPPAPTTPIATQSAKKWTLAEVEQKMEEMLGGEGLDKVRNVTYFKKGIWHSNWTEYVVYDKPGANQDDGRRDPKTNVAQYTYAYKLFVTVEDDGSLSFTYRRNNGAKIDALVNAMVGKFADMGITHINFPIGLPDDEKGLWRKALAEKGIVYKGMGIDVDKAESMIKAAKEKHLPSDKLIEFKYRIALQMQENNANKGKTPGSDEADYIDGLINTYRYRGFTNGYARGLKSLINKTLIAGDQDRGAINKVAAYRAFRQVFDVYQEILRCGSINNLRCGSIEEIINTANPQEQNRKQVFVTPEQKQKLLGLGLNNISKITPEQLVQIYKILLPAHTEAAEKEIYKVLDNNRLKDVKVLGARALPAILVRNIFNEAKKSVDAINSDNLVALGVDEIGLPKDGQVSLGIGDYTRKVEAEVALQAAEAQNNSVATPSRSNVSSTFRSDSARSL